MWRWLRRTSPPGHLWRPKHGKCPGCGVAENKWCAEGCAWVDPMDYR